MHDKIITIIPIIITLKLIFKIFIITIKIIITKINL